MPEYQPISIETDAKERFESLRRRLEAADDQDYTQTETLLWLIQESPDPMEKRLAENMRDVKNADESELTELDDV